MRLALVLSLGCAATACKSHGGPAPKDAAGLSPEDTLVKIAALADAGDEKSVTAFFSAEACKYAEKQRPFLRIVGCKSTMMFTPGKPMIQTPHPEAKLKIEEVKPSSKFDGVYIVAAIYEAPGLPAAEHFGHFSYNFKLVDGHWHVVDDFKGL